MSIPWTKIRKKLARDSIRAVEFDTGRPWKKELFVEQRQKCFWCGRFCRKRWEEKHPMSFTLDHVVPRGKGGEHAKRNTVGACNECNRRRNEVQTKLDAGISLPIYLVKNRYAPTRTVQKTDTKMPTPL